MSKNYRNRTTLKNNGEKKTIWVEEKYKSDATPTKIIFIAFIFFLILSFVI